MTDLLVVEGDPIDQLADWLTGLTVDQVRTVSAMAPPHELALIEAALSRLAARANQVETDELLATQAWRRDPSTMMVHLESNLWKRWDYVALLGAKFKQAVEGVHPNQVWMLPARYGKTTIGSVWGPVWTLDQYPWMRVILTSYGDDLAIENSSTVQDKLNEYADNLRCRVRRGRAAKKRWRTTDGGGVMAAGVGSSMTGFGGDVIVVDDPFKDLKQALSPTYRDAVWGWMRGVVWLRRQSERSAVIVIMTRWHEDDLIGRLLDPPEGEPLDWHIVRIPAIAEDPETVEGKPWERLPDPLGREPGEPLEPERFSITEVKGRANFLGTHLAAALEQQRPAAAEGNIIKRAWWRFYTGRPATFEWSDAMICWDSSFGDSDGSSFCVGAVWARVGADKYLLDLVRDRMDYPTFKRSVSALAGKWPEVRKIYVEAKANGPAVLADLKSSISGLLPFNPDPYGSKVARVNAITGDIESGHVWLPDPFPTQAGKGGLIVEAPDVRVNREFVAGYIDELALFDNGAHDDQVDVTTMCLLQWRNVDVVATEERKLLPDGGTDRR